MYFRKLEPKKLFLRFKKKLKQILALLFKAIPYSWRVKFNLLDREHYSYCIFHACNLAKKLGLKSVSIIEFGVASGNGLRYIEYVSSKFEKIFGLKIEIYGFDKGDGLPEPVDFRDLPYHWKSGFFKMDKNKLNKKLNRSTLIIGDINETAESFFEDYSPAPIGAVFHDFDFYSSTKTSLNLFCNTEYFLPRVFNYFDDTIGSEIELYNDYSGERLAINEFNNENKLVKFSPAYHLITKKYNLEWPHKIWITHFFDHSLYNKFISSENQQISMQ